MSDIKTFADFGVQASICKSLEEVGIISPFPIQEMTLPLALNGADIIGQARTGTGKTLGFGLPLIQRTDLDGGLQGLVIVPTRELCLQVSQDLAQAGKGRGVKVAAVYGGKAIQPQIDAIADGAHLIVGTPGRLLDLARRGVMNLSRCHGLVLDEADEMLDLGFLPDVEQLIEQCADERQTLLFSATMPAAIVSLARRYMVKPTFMRADVEEITIAPQTKQYFFSCHRMDKPAVLARILSTPERGLCVTFCRTKRMADTLAEELRERGIEAQAIHSDLRQEARERALKKFRDGKITVLCATEVAARGLDIDDVTHVVNYDCPDDEKMYLHRIGRTGRAGADGVAITFVLWNEIPRVEMIRRDLDIEEEVQEVFSTSPLLDELFDLPPREERKKVPSPPQARLGKESRSRRRGEKEQNKGRSGSTSPSSKPDSSKPVSSKPVSSKPVSSKPAIHRAKAVSPSPTSTAGEDTEVEMPARTRTRRRTKIIDGETVSSRTTKPQTDSNDSTSNDSTSNDSRSSGRTRTRSASRSSADDSRTPSTDGGSDEKPKDNGPKDGGSKDGGSKDGGSKNDGAKGRSTRGGGRGGRDGNTLSRDRSGSRSKDPERRLGGRGNRSDADGGDSRRRTRQVVDSAEARGDGKPSLGRKMEVVHLP